jgi:4-diphosphocytidyl-2-C-methyl-D-erythritol kinase
VAITSFTLPSFAKINWSLRVLGRRPDGYHEVRTFLQTISLHDEIRFELAHDGIDLSSDDPEIPLDRTNLIICAAEKLHTRYAPPRGARISLRKIIPMQGGLGGASSNAATTLIGLSRLWDLNLSVEDFFEIASPLGADVPFFLLGGTALATGTGTQVRPSMSNASAALLIVKPLSTVSTKEAYRALRGTALTTEQAKPILAVSRKRSFSNDSYLWNVETDLVNDFETVIFDKEPEIRRAKDALIKAGARASLLAGSGSSVFGIFDGPEARDSALKRIETEPGWRIFPCATMSRIEYSRALDLPESLRSF